jgi:16S rRNA pseudouridine516 synthase
MLRIERILANRGYCTRSAAGQFLRDYQVFSAGQRLTRPDTRVAPASVTIDSKPIDPEFLLLAMNKPAGVTCSHKEWTRDGDELIYALLPERWQWRDPVIATVGRLDKDTTGLILLTDDGQLLHRLTSPKKHVPKVYQVTLAGPLTGQEAPAFASGTLMLEDEDKPLLPAELTPTGPHSCHLTLHEGRYHQVKRMFAALGNEVAALHRLAFGKLTLGQSPLADLPEGKWTVIQESDVI